MVVLSLVAFVIGVGGFVSYRVFVYQKTYSRAEFDELGLAVDEIFSGLEEVVGPGREVVFDTGLDESGCDDGGFGVPGAPLTGVGRHIRLEAFETVEEDRAAIERARRYLERRGFEVDPRVNDRGTLTASSSEEPTIRASARADSERGVLNFGASAGCLPVRD